MEQDGSKLVVVVGIMAEDIEIGVVAQEAKDVVDAMRSANNGHGDGLTLRGQIQCRR